MRGNAKTLPQVGYRLGRALEGCHSVLVVGDNRPSHEALAGALVHGLEDAGVNVLYGGVLPTAAASTCIDYFAADYAVVVTASHNPPQDNGFKLIVSSGDKADASTREKVWTRMKSVVPPAVIGRPLPPVNKEIARVYLDRITPEHIPSGRFTFDCAYGAVYPSIKRVFGEGRYLHHGDGKKINVGVGATHPEAILAEAKGAWGFSFDGDGDRLVAVTPGGRLLDGDAILYALAVARHRRGLLPKEIVVGTVLSNGALDLALGREGIHFVRTQVGDSHVAAKMREEGAVLGAEPSGHVLLDAPSDGIRTALALAALAEQTDVDTLLSPYVPLPQAHRTMPLGEGLEAAEKRAEMWRGYLGGTGRIVLRPSGTEPVIRVMVECTSMELATTVANSIVKS
ncbi:MAG: hypothetical protein J5755_04670 [Clostridia bacterium]|nr:hypothetical protein [Clostridia bacterium]